MLKLNPVNAPERYVAVSLVVGRGAGVECRPVAEVSTRQVLLATVSSHWKGNTGSYAIDENCSDQLPEYDRSRRRNRVSQTR